MFIEAAKLREIKRLNRRMRQEKYGFVDKYSFTM